ncbi:MAG: endonuclease/exonuclease/phosphatase family protein [Pirellulaceae bacterium]|nr:endonuclease/exonuclease/phosphatase family protein [Pirellulaceae bacterium]
MVDDQGRQGGLAAGRAFVVAGDLNSDPIDGDSRHAAIINLLAIPQVSNEIVPKSLGAVDAHQRQGKANLRHMAPPENDTADFSDGMVGNLRVDYVLPSRNLKLVASGVFWPSGSQPSVKPDVLKKLLDASDHHLVWIDVQKN